MVSLQNGRLHVVMKGRKKVEISAQAVLNDGTWHHVVRLILQGVMLIPPDDCLPHICELMRSCWKMEPRDRIKFPEILDILQMSSAHSQSTLPRPPAFPVTPQTVVEVLDAENYLKPLQPEPKEYLQTLPD